MPDRLRERRTWIDFALVIVLLTVAGAVGAFVWNWVWTPPVGVAYGHKWVAEDEAGLQAMFDATGWYVVIASVIGLVVGLLAALFLDRVPLLTLAGVVIGSVLGTIVMLNLGLALGPDDPHEIARTADDGTHLEGQLEVTGKSPWIAMPAGALIGLTIVFIGLGPRRRDRVDDLTAG